jgi:hypothetical protein
VRLPYNASEAYGPLSGGSTYNATIENLDDQDWYVFYVSGEQQLDIPVTSTTSDRLCAVEAHVQDEAGNVPSSYVTPGQNESQELRWTSPPGTTKYYLVVKNADTGGGECSFGTSNTYSFQVNPPGAVTTNPGGSPAPNPSCSEGQ